MFEQVASWDEGLAAYVAELDPAVNDGWDAKQLVLHHVQMEKLHSAAKTVMLQRVARTRTLAHQGDRSMIHWLAREAGISLSEAITTVGTAARLEECPAMETALRAGKLSRAQANEITAAAVVDPASETRLLQKAQRGTFKDLKQFSARVKAAVRDDNAEHLRITVLQGMQPYRKAIFDAARAGDDREPPGAYDADALVATARDSLSRTSNTSSPKSRRSGAVLATRACGQLVSRKVLRQRRAAPGARARTGATRRCSRPGSRRPPRPGRSTPARRDPAAGPRVLRARPGLPRRGSYDRVDRAARGRTTADVEAYVVAAPYRCRSRRRRSASSNVSPPRDFWANQRMPSLH